MFPGSFVMCRSSPVLRKYSLEYFPEKEDRLILLLNTFLDRNYDNEDNKDNHNEDNDNKDNDNEDNNN